MPLTVVYAGNSPIATAYLAGNGHELQPDTFQPIWLRNRLQKLQKTPLQANIPTGLPKTELDRIPERTYMAITEQR
ncbi:MAG: hypothetical protein MK179_11005 [Pirellulaceae bacterium]|nr:hypothetical protein [Pirellulaceae bacterium]